MLELIGDVLALPEDALRAVDINHAGAALLIGLLPPDPHHPPTKGNARRPAADVQVTHNPDIPVSCHSRVTAAAQGTTPAPPRRSNLVCRTPAPRRNRCRPA